MPAGKSGKAGKGAGGKGEGAGGAKGRPGDQKGGGKEGPGKGKGKGRANGDGGGKGKGSEEAGQQQPQGMAGGNDGIASAASGGGNETQLVWGKAELERALLEMPDSSMLRPQLQQALDAILAKEAASAKEETVASAGQPMGHHAAHNKLDKTRKKLEASKARAEQFQAQKTEIEEKLRLCEEEQAQLAKEIVELQKHATTASLKVAMPNGGPQEAAGMLFESIAAGLRSGTSNVPGFAQALQSAMQATQHLLAMQAMVPQPQEVPVVAAEAAGTSRPEGAAAVERLEDDNMEDEEEVDPDEWFDKLADQHGFERTTGEQRKVQIQKACEDKRMVKDGGKYKVKVGRKTKSG